MVTDKKGSSTNSAPSHILKMLSPGETCSVRRIHQSISGYAPTPLVSLPSLAQELGVRGIYVKDESYRFGLKAFKCLGGVYALCRLICKELHLDSAKISFPDLQSPAVKDKINDMVFVTATDGNHGKGIAWAAGQLGCRAVVYMPKGSSEIRAQAIRGAGEAEVTITGLSYDDAVQHAFDQSKEKGWYFVQDTSWNGYEEIPLWIAQGYTTMTAEALEQLASLDIPKPTHVFLQAGVGCMAGSVLGYLVNYYGEDCPKTAIVEPETVACIFQSARQGNGTPCPVTGIQQTIMAGLNCGEPCSITWPILRDYAVGYFACPDYVAARGMRILGNPVGDDARVVSGESGAVTLGLLTMILEKGGIEEAGKALGLNGDSVILLFNTEGDTDPESYRAIVHDGKYPMPVNGGKIGMIFNKN